MTMDANEHTRDAVMAKAAIIESNLERLYAAGFQVLRMQHHPDGRMEALVSKPKYKKPRTVRVDLADDCEAL